MSTTSPPRPGRGAPDVAIHRLEPGDTDTVHAVFAALSAHSVWLRFHTGLPRLTPRMATRLATVCPGRHEVLVARVGGEAVGLARWHRDPGNRRRAEVALEVADAAQGRGVGARLLAELLRSAHASGIREVTAEVLAENVRVRRWLQRLGAVDAHGPDPTVRLVLGPGGVPLGCGSMGACWSGCSDPSGSRTAPASGSHGGRARATSSPASSPDAVVRSRPRPSSTSCGPRRPAA